LLGVTLVSAICLGACAQQVPTAPEPVLDVSPASPGGVTPSKPAAITPAAAAKTRVVDRFDLLNGTWTIALSGGPTLSGTYGGETTAPSSGQPRATIEGSVTAISPGSASGTGSLSGTGMGAFAGEGEFSVALRALVSSGSRSTEVRVTLRGQATISCTSAGRVRVTLNGTGTTKGSSADASGTLQHELSNAGCSPD
jgi:hypothetical protein